MVLHGIAWYCMVLHGIALYCTILHYLALSCTILHYLAHKVSIQKHVDDESSDCFSYSFSGSESESPMLLYNGRHAKSEKVGGWLSCRSGWLLELLTELTKLMVMITKLMVRAKLRTTRAIERAQARLSVVVSCVTFSASIINLHFHFLLH